MKPAAWVGIVAALITVGACVNGSYIPTTGYYSTLTLNPGTLEMRVSGYRFVQPDSRAYFRFTDGRTRHLISDCEAPQRVAPWVCYNLFTVTHENRLWYRTKFLRLLTGPYGVVYGQVTYYYSPEYGKNSLETMSRQNDLRYVPPATSSRIDGLERLPLSAVSVVRIFKAPPEYLIASANYSSDGHLYEISVYSAKGGQWSNDNLLSLYHGAFGVGSSIGDDVKTREFFRLPAPFPVSEHLAGKAEAFSATGLESVLDVVNLHYDESYVVRQDSYAPGKPPATLFLTFPKTKEDEALRAVDRARGFADIEHTRVKSTP